MSQIHLSLLVLWCLFAASSNGMVLAQESPEPACMFPANWQIAPEPLQVKDEGRTAPELLDEFDGEGTNFHPFGLMGDPFVLVDEGKFRMWFTSGFQEVDGREYVGFAYTESLDGILWEDPKAEDPYVLINLVFQPALEDWDSLGMETNTVLRLPNSGEYLMYYAGIYTKNAYAIGMATSEDGLTWTKHPEAVLPALYDWEQPIHGEDGLLVGGVVEPTVLYDVEAGLFRMWYSALGVKDGLWGGRMGYATSSDGITWERRPEPVFLPDVTAWDAGWVSHSHVIADPINGYHLFYAGESYDGAIYAIGHAFSYDGIDWIRNPANPIIRNEPDTWRSSMVGGPSALIYDDLIYVWYMGAQNQDFAYVHFGLATAPCSS